MELVTSFLSLYHNFRSGFVKRDGNYVTGSAKIRFLILVGCMYNAKGSQIVGVRSYVSSVLTAITTKITFTKL